MCELQVALAKSFKANSREFIGWDVEMIVDYYLQFGVELSRDQVKEAIGYIEQ